MSQRGAALALLFAWAFFFGWPAHAAGSALRKPFDVPSGPAPATLKRFVSQSGVQLMYVADEVFGVKTNSVKGEYTAGEAVSRLLANTGLTAVETKSGAIAINRINDPNDQRAAQKTPSDRPANPSNPKSSKNHQKP